MNEWTWLRAIVDELGETKAAALVGASRITIARACAGFHLTASTRTSLRAARERLAAERASVVARAS